MHSLLRRRGNPSDIGEDRKSSVPKKNRRRAGPQVRKMPYSHASKRERGSVSQGRSETKNDPSEDKQGGAARQEQRRGGRMIRCRSRKSTCIGAYCRIWRSRAISRVKIKSETGPVRGVRGCQYG